MYEPNPFAGKRTLSIDERMPARATARADIRAISIRGGRGSVSGTPDEQRIEGLLASLRRPERVELFEVDYGSSLRRVPNIDRFRNIRFAHVAGRGIRDYGALYRLRRLKSLFLVNYQQRNLEDFPRLALDSFRAIRGRLEQLAVRARFALLQDCARLRDLSGSAVGWLIMETCKRVSFPTLCNVQRLRRLELLGCRGLDNFDWIAGCETLQHLVVTAVPCSRIDLTGLTAARSLRAIFLPAPEKLIASTSASTRAAVSNGDVWYRRGVRGHGSDPVVNT